MDLIVAVIGALCIFIGIWLIFFYNDLAKEKRGGFSFKLRTAGIGLIIIGIGLIFKNCI
ncbi:hypothetical protein [Flavobacterium sp.]|jgi:hypothetical protein|uniref:hypothetical protein n=1 Tax=Flavobacterium sp. TaxID=239 RepID=UPI0037BFC917